MTELKKLFLAKNEVKAHDLEHIRKLAFNIQKYNESVVKEKRHKRIPLQAWMGASAIQVTSIFIVILFLSFATIAQTPVITTIAGSNMFTFYTPANDTVAQLFDPTGVALDGKGNMYIADSRDFVIRKVNLQTNQISIFAGNGDLGFSGDGGPAIDAQLFLIGEVYSTNSPTGQKELTTEGGLAIDKNGNIYIVDAGNLVIRKVDTFGFISTYAGNGNYGYTGDGGPATAASIKAPTSVAVDMNNNVYVADVESGVVRKINAFGIISTFAGKDTPGYSGDGGPASLAQLNSPIGVCTDKHNNVYIADLYGFVRKVDTMGIISTFAGNGSDAAEMDGVAATGSSLVMPIAVVADDIGNIYIDDFSMFKIRKVDTLGKITTYAGVDNVENYDSYDGDGGLATAALVPYPYGIAIDHSGNLFISTVLDDRIREVNKSGIISTVAGNNGYSGNGGLATNALINNPVGLVTDKLGNIYFSDVNANVVRQISTNGTMNTIAGNGINGFNNDNIAATAAELNAPQGLAMDDEGNLYIADNGNNLVRMIDHTTGIISTVLGGGSIFKDSIAATACNFVNPIGLCFDHFGNLYVSNPGYVVKVDFSSGILYRIAGGMGTASGDGGPAKNARFGQAGYMAIDSAGNLYVADATDYSVRVINPVSGMINAFAGNADSAINGIPFRNGIPATSASIGTIFGVAVDDTGMVYLSNGNQIFIVEKSTGLIYLIAGNNTAGKSGNNGPSGAADCYGITELDFDKNGDLIFTDQYNRAIRKINLGTYDTASTNSGNGNTTKGLTLYPNPSNGNFVIAGLVDSNTNGHMVEVVVDDVLGRELYRTRGKATNNYLNIPVSLNQSVANGIYYCYIQGGDVNTTVKVRVMR